MQCFLKDADAKEQQGYECVRNWVAKIREPAYDVEDARLKDITDSRTTYGIKDLDDNEDSTSETIQKMMQLSPRNRYPHVVDDDIIGFKEHTNTLLNELVKDEERRCIVSIVGVGGLRTTVGKQWLNKRVLNLLLKIIWVRAPDLLVTLHVLVFFFVFFCE
ncbi:hypothetical protein MKX01_004136 [Papaver californicum]|nr:hypothetical protein MKX01_004136 [Papaver californicum]